MLQPPPPHVLNVLGSAQAFPKLADRIADCFDRPANLFPWFAVPEEADKVLQSYSAAA
jgi:hypothetical protein